MAEAGFAGVETGTWFGLTVHPATSRPIIAAANGIVVRALSSRDLRAKLAAIGVDTIAGTPEAFGAHIVAEITKWSQVIKRSAIKAD
jgi:tripartite-type tricarboxylate transporter receptor subunit TctC